MEKEIGTSFKIKKGEFSGFLDRSKTDRDLIPINPISPTKKHDITPRKEGISPAPSKVSIYMKNYASKGSFKGVKKNKKSMKEEVFALHNQRRANSIIANPIKMLPSHNMSADAGLLQSSSKYDLILKKLFGHWSQKPARDQI
mmetsp:Transcript_19872/g.19495  ORF Transcript_19872/g.19495 Transcript_19872/m.19495 type:complete len:143 (+) Transcript_19872:76-504(+)